MNCLENMVVAHCPMNLWEIIQLLRWAFLYLFIIFHALATLPESDAYFVLWDVSTINYYINLYLFVKIAKCFKSPDLLLNYDSIHVPLIV